MSFKLLSPNSVLANALNRTVDLLRPRIALNKPSVVEFVVGTQINGTPHLGTNLTQAAAFVLAREVRNVYSIDTRVVFGALDNAPKSLELDPESFHSYQKTYRHELGYENVREVTERMYREFFEGLSDRTAVDYDLQLYSDQQSTPAFRSTFLKSLEYSDRLRWCLAPSTGIVHIRFPCPVCHKAEKRGERTKLLRYDGESALFEALCFDHGRYEALITAESDDYLDLSTLYRNLVKEAQYANQSDVLAVMVKGGDWAFACQLVDWALGAMGYSALQCPVRCFTPQILTDAGAKLSKTLINQTGMEVPDDLRWILNTGVSQQSADDYLDAVLVLLTGLLADPKHFFRSFSYNEINRLMQEQSPESLLEQRARPIRIYRKYFELIAKGTKTIEIRVGYSSMMRIKPGQLLKFVCQDDAAMTEVLAVRQYKTFDALFDAEDYSRINPGLSKEEQLSEVRKIFPRDKEAMGVLAIEVKKVSSD
jgi:ASC-1-like (ASCH) protein